jgi:hypothetical protein
MEKISIEEVKKATAVLQKKQADELEAKRKEKEEVKKRSEEILKFFEEVENMEEVEEIKKLLDLSDGEIKLYRCVIIGHTVCSFNKNGFHFKISFKTVSKREMAEDFARGGVHLKELSENFFEGLQHYVSAALK